ncbi:MAG: hypothetical protein KF901_07805 [Myxococcales bacterium]|nr:hypothetical protein [Myxococcales bacterium]
MRTLTLLALGVVGSISVAAQPPPPDDLGQEPAAAASEPTDARDERARSLFIAGAAAYEDGRFEVALANFQAAYELSERPGLLYNVALSHDRLRHDDEALAAYRAYLEALPDNPHRAQVEPRIEALERAISEREARERALEEQLREAQSRPAVVVEAPSRSRWWIAAVVGAVVAVGLGVGLAVGLSGRGGPELEQSDFGGVTFTLGGAR